MFHTSLGSQLPAKEKGLVEHDPLRYVAKVEFQRSLFDVLKSIRADAKQLLVHQPLVVNEHWTNLPIEIRGSVMSFISKRCSNYRHDNINDSWADDLAASYIIDSPVIWPGGCLCKLRSFRATAVYAPYRYSQFKLDYAMSFGDSTIDQQLNAYDIWSRAIVHNILTEQRMALTFDNVMEMSSAISHFESAFLEDGRSYVMEQPLVVQPSYCAARDEAWRIGTRFLSRTLLVNVFKLAYHDFSQKMVAHFRKRSLVLIELKSIMISFILTNQFGLAEGATYVERQQNRISFCFSLLIDLLHALFHFLMFVLSLFKNSLETLMDFIEDDYFLVDAIVNIFISWSLYRLYNRFSGQRVREKWGSSSSNAAETQTSFHDGVKCLAPTDRLSVIDEMSLPGSEFSPSRIRAVGAISFVEDGVVSTVNACFWRHDDYLVTNEHVANIIFNGVKPVQLSGLREKRGNYFVDVDNGIRKEADYFDLDSNESLNGDMDVFAKKLSKAEWAKLQVQKASYKKRSRYDLSVCTVGFNNNLLVTAAGKTLKDSGVMLLHYTASTLKGFSGSPVYCGASVVAMHRTGTSAQGIGIRAEQIVRMLPVDEVNSVSTSNSYTSEDLSIRDKFHDGREVTYEQMADHSYTVMNRYGEVYTGYDQDFVIKNFSSARVSDYQQFQDDEDEADRYAAQEAFSKQLKSRHRGQIAYYDDECAMEGIQELPRESHVICNMTNEPTPEGLELLDHFLPRVEKLGYDKDAFGYPKINKGLEVTSLNNHLNMYLDRVKTCIEPPTPQEMEKVASLVLRMLPHNRFVVDVDWRSKDSALFIVDSSIIKSAKSPGFPYTAEGMPTNEVVIKRLTKNGLVERVFSEWESPIELRVFIKNEPHKKTKLEKDMPRIITGVPLHKTIKHAMLFKNLVLTSTENWRKSRIIYGFSPVVPGSIENVMRRFRKRKILQSDKKCWDYNMFTWVYDINKIILCGLAIKPSAMTEEEYEKYCSEVRNAVDELNHRCSYRCSNGRRFRVPVGGIMKPGCFLTILMNSIAQLVLHVLAMLRMGYMDEQILSDEFDIAAGGDDVLQAIPDLFNLDEYRAAFARFGVRLDDVHVLDTIDGAEFFSNIISVKNNAPSFIPVRLTKHIYKLTRNKREDLSMALSAHMLNYCHSRKHYCVFRDMFMYFYEKFPEEFPLSLVKSQLELRHQCIGYEGVF